MKTEFDQRQLERMKSLILSLQERKIGVPKFVSDQWTLIEALENIDLGWKQKYFDLINEIEDLYSSAVDQGLKQISQNDETTIDKILRHMLGLLKEV